MTDQLDLFGQVATKAAPIPAATNPRPRRAPHPAGELATRRHWRGIRASWCRTCKAATLSGLDADECALDAKVDTQPVTALGEVMAQLAGRGTYTLRLDLARSITLLERRNAGSITRRPAEGATGLPVLAWDVHVEHSCQPTPDQLRAEARLDAVRTTLDPDARPPY